MMERTYLAGLLCVSIVGLSGQTTFGQCTVEESTRIDYPGAVFADEQFGVSVAADNDLLIVGSLYNGIFSFDGEAHIFGRDVGGSDRWVHIQSLTATDGGEFGISVGLDGLRPASD